MAVTYKGLTIKFGGDTTELQSALKKIQTETRNTQSDLKAINKSLEFNPGKTELLEQKVRNLNKAYEETKTKLDAYKQAMQQLEEKKRSGEQLTEEEQRQYESLQREIYKCENQLDSFGRELNETKTEAEASKTALYQFGQTLENNASTLDKYGQNMQALGKGMMAVSGAVTGASLAAFNEVDKGFDNVIRATGATGEAADDLRRSVENVGTSVAGSQKTWEEVGSTVGEVNTRFGVTGDDLESLTDQFLQFSSITGVDSVTAVQNAAKAMTAFGVDAEHTDEVLGVIAKTAQETGVSADYLMQQLVNNGTTFRELGLDIDDAAVMLGRFEAAGIPADQMLAGLRKAATNCAESGEDLNTTLVDLTQRLQDPATAAEATQEAIELFGSKSALAFIDAAQSGRISFEDLEQALGEYSGVVSSTFDETIDPIDQSRVAMRELQTAGAELGSEIGSVLAPIISEFAGFVHEVKDAFAALSPEQQEMIAKAILLTGAIGGAVFVFGNLLSAAGQIGGVLKSVAGGWSSLTGLIAANPIMLGVAAVAAAVAGLTWFFTQTEKGRELWAKFTGWITKKFEAVKKFFAGVPDWWKGVWSKVTTTVDNVKKKFSDVWNAIKSVTSTVWNAIKSVIEGVMNTIKGIIDSVTGAIRTVTEGGWNGVKTVISGVVGAVGGIVSTAWNGLKTVTSTVFEGVKSVASTAWNGIKTTIGNVTSNISSAAKSAWDGMKSTAGTIWNGIKSTAGTVWGGIKSAMTGPIEAAKSTIGSVIGGIQGIINGLTGKKVDVGVNDKTSTVQGIVDRAQRAINGLYGRTVTSYVDVQRTGIRRVWAEGSLVGGGLSVWSAAAGGIAVKPSIGIFGEAGDEALIPLSNRNKVRPFAQAVAAEINASGGGNVMNVSVNVNATVNGKTSAYELGQSIARGLSSTMKQKGYVYA